MNELEQRWRDLGEFIREQRHLGEMSLRKLSERAGISNPYLSQIERGLRRPSAEILQQIANALQISATTLYVRAGILDEEVEAPRLIDLIRHDPELTEEQKKTLVTVYESFRATNAATLEGVLRAVGAVDGEVRDDRRTAAPGDATDADESIEDAAPEGAPSSRPAGRSRSAQRPSSSESTDASPSR